jgi:hypothetical protein
VTGSVNEDVTQHAHPNMSNLNCLFNVDTRLRLFLAAWATRTRSQRALCPPALPPPSVVERWADGRAGCRARRVGGLTAEQLDKEVSAPHTLRRARPATASQPHCLAASLPRSLAASLVVARRFARSSTPWTSLRPAPSRSTSSVSSACHGA